MTFFLQSWLHTILFLGLVHLLSSQVTYVKELIPTTLVENEVPVRLEFVFASPTGDGPFPTLIFHHGSTGDGSDPSLFTRTIVTPAVAEYFVNRGWLVVFPMRRGRGASDGLYDEGFRPDRSAYSCQPTEALPGLERALADAGAILQVLRLRPEVDPHRIILAGQSRGGMLAIVQAGEKPAGVVGAINFVGGWTGESCGTANLINPPSFARGAAFERHTLWLYAANDPFYSLTHSRANHAAFTSSGGKGTFSSFSLPDGVSGHALAAYSEYWSSILDEYLEGLPARSVATLPHLLGWHFEQGSLQLRLSTEPGRRYLLQNSPSLTKLEWLASGALRFATENETLFHVPLETPEGFWRVVVD